MNSDLQKSKANLVIDHENLDYVSIPNLKRKVNSLREARTVLLEEEFSAIIFLSVLEEANEIDVFVKGVRSHPKLSDIQIFCEYGLLLALPKGLNLIGFEESDVSTEEQDTEEALNLDSDLSDSISIEEKAQLLEDFKKISAKGLVRLEYRDELAVSKEDLFQQFLILLREEFNS